MQRHSVEVWCRGAVAPSCSSTLEPSSTLSCTALLEAESSVDGVGSPVGTRGVTPVEMVLPARSSCWPHGRRPIRSMAVRRRGHQRTLMFYRLR
jgi:hypothetical protein